MGTPWSHGWGACSRACVSPSVQGGAEEMQSLVLIGPTVLPLLDLSPGGRGQMSILWPPQVPKRPIPGVQANRRALENPKGNPRGGARGTWGQKSDLLPGSIHDQQRPFLPGRALSDSVALKTATSKAKPSGCRAVLWVSDTCYHYLSIPSNMVLSPRVCLIIIKLKTCSIPGIFWKQ